MLYLLSNQSNEIVVTWSERCTTTFPFDAVAAYQLRCEQDGAFPAESNCIIDTYAKLLFIPTTFEFELRSMATAETTSFSILRSSNQSQGLSRYDKFTVSVGDLSTGQYTYTAYEGDISLVETGLAYIQMGEQAFVSATNTITYAEPSTGTFDNTFDYTFN
jgi:hypothetical protein